MDAFGQLQPQWVHGVSGQLSLLSPTLACYRSSHLWQTLDLETGIAEIHQPPDGTPLSLLRATPALGVVAMVSVGESEPVKVCDRDLTVRAILKPPTGQPFLLCDVQFDQSGEYLYAVEDAPTCHITVWEWRFQRHVVTVDLTPSPSYSLVVSPYDWRTFVAYAADAATVWEIQTCRDVATATPTPIQLEFTARQRRGSRVERRNSLENMLDMASLAEEAVVHLASAVFFDESTVLCGGVDGELIEFDLNMGSTTILCKSTAFGAGTFNSMICHSSGIIAGSPKALRWFSLSSSSAIMSRIEDLDSSTRQLLWQTPGESLLVVGDSGFEKFESESGARKVFSKGLASAASAVDISTVSGQSVAVCVTDKHVGVFSTAGEHMHTTHLDPAFSVVAWATATHAPCCVAAYSNGSVGSFRIQPNGQLVALKRSLLLDSKPTNTCITSCGSFALAHTSSQIVCFDPVTLQVKCSVSLEVVILDSHLLMKGAGQYASIALLVKTAVSYGLVVFALPTNQQTLADNYFSSALTLDFTRCPVTCFRLTDAAHVLSVGGEVVCTCDGATGRFLLYDLPEQHQVSARGKPVDLLAQATVLEPKHRLRAEFGSRVSVKLSPLGYFVAITSSSNSVMVSLTTNTELLASPARLNLSNTIQLKHPQPMSHVAWVPDGSAMVMTSADSALFGLTWHTQGAAEGRMRAIAKAVQAMLETEVFPIAKQTIKRLDEAKPMAANALVPVASRVSRTQLTGGGSGVRSKTALEQVTEAASETTTPPSAMLSELQEIRSQLKLLVAENASKPEDEQLTKDELVVDLTEKDRLAISLEEAVQAKREDIELQILEKQFLRNNLKKKCWDSMEVPTKRIYAFDTTTEVPNFAIRQLTATEKSLLKRVISIRATELNEDALLAALDATEQEEIQQQQDKQAEAQAAAADANESGDDVDEGEDSDSGAAAQAAEESASAAAALTEKEEKPQDESRRFLYTPLQLVHTARKRNQIVLLKNVVRAIKLSFNELFEEIRQSKQEEISKIEKKNEEITKICEELKITTTLYHAQTHVLETPELLLTVADDEIRVPKVLTAEEQAAKEEAERQEAERRAREAEDNIRERGVEDMMYGQLEDRLENDVWADIPPPDFMDEIPKEQWDEDQTKAAIAHEAAVKELLQLREKRKQNLEGQLRTLTAQIEKIRQKFDERLYELFHVRIRAEQDIAREELQILKLVQSLQLEQDLIDEVSALQTHIAQVRKERHTRTEAVEAATLVMEEVKAEYAEMAAADKALEKSFKTRRELHEAEAFMDVLFRLYRRRPKRGAGPVDIPPLNKSTDCPEGLPDHIWDRLVKLRNEKIASEMKVRAKGEELLQVQEYLRAREGEVNALNQDLEASKAEVKRHNQQRVILNLNTEMLITVRHGDVELSHANDFDPTFDSALLLSTSVVEALNQRIRQLGQGKLDHIKRKIKMAQGVRMLEWEHRRLELESEELIETTRDVQLFKVKRNTMSDKSVDASQEIEKLEQAKKARQRAHAKATIQLKQKLVKLQRQAKQRSTANQSMGEGVDSLAVEVGQHTQVRQMQLTTIGDGGASERMHLAKRRHKMTETIREQDAEMARLRQMVEKLRMKTFPTFPTPSAATRY
eukprot:m.258593 g.258593  ORF g.258593 m.258593 type:complete len:1621 (-) comp15544_c0_seq1:226-5088(-)